MRLSSFSHMGRVRHCAARSHLFGLQSRQETGASEPSVSLKISPTEYSSGLRVRRYPPPRPHALNDICLDKDADDAFKVFLRYILRLCDGVEPLVFAVLAQGKLKHDPQGVSALG